MRNNVLLPSENVFKSAKTIPYRSRGIQTGVCPFSCSGRFENPIKRVSDGSFPYFCPHRNRVPCAALAQKAIKLHKSFTFSLLQSRFARQLPRQREPKNIPHRGEQPSSEGANGRQSHRLISNVYYLISNVPSLVSSSSVKSFICRIQPLEYSVSSAEFLFRARFSVFIPQRFIWYFAVKG